MRAAIPFRRVDAHVARIRKDHSTPLLVVAPVTVEISELDIADRLPILAIKKDMLIMVFQELRVWGETTRVETGVFVLEQELTTPYIGRIAGCFRRDAYSKIGRHREKTAVKSTVVNNVKAQSISRVCSILSPHLRPMALCGWHLGTGGSNSQ